MKKLSYIWLVIVAAIAVPPLIRASVPLSTASALDGSGFAWVSAGCNPKGSPTSVVADTHDGVDAWKSGHLTLITNCTPLENWLQTTVVGPGTLTFWWKVSSEEDWDVFGFWIGYAGMHYIEGPDDQISGEVGWTQRTFAIPEGTQYLEWAYMKDYQEGGPPSWAGDDRAWLDQVFFTPDPPTITNQPLETVVLLPVGTNVSFTVGYRGNPTPNVFWQLNGTNLPGKTNATLTLTNLQVTQSGNYRALVTNVYGSDTSDVISLTVFQPVLLQWGLDTTNLSWTTGGDAGAGWLAFSNNLIAHDGIDFARSGPPPDDYDQLSFDSWVQTTVTGPGTLKYWWKIIGLEADQYSLSVGGITTSNTPAMDEAWQEEIVAVPTGSKVLKWTYHRDDFISTDDDDGGYLDQVRFSPATNAPPIFSRPDYSTNGFSARIELDPFRGYHIQRSTNLTSWVDLTNFTTTESIFDFLDPSATNISTRYYRIKSP